jgi:hypothetical protein
MNGTSLPSDTIAGTLIEPTSVLAFFSIGLCVLRIYTRSQPVPNLGCDDFYISVAVVKTQPTSI